MPTAVERVLKAMAAERDSHLSRFAGREDFLQHLIVQLDHRKNVGGYVLLVGHEGSGKSAICSKLSQLLAARVAEKPQSGESARLQHLFPWLPGCLLCVCKQIASPIEVVQALMAQAEALLGESLRNNDEGNEWPVDYDAFVSSTGRLADQATTMQQLRNRTVRQLKHEQRWLLYALEQIRQRYGQAYVVVDAADELQVPALEFLPSVLPAGVVVLLSSRPGELAAWCGEKLRALPCEMQHLSRPEISLLTGVSDEQSAAARQFNDRVYRESGGWPLLVATVAQDVHAQGGSFEQVRVDGQMDSVFERQALMWNVQSSAPPPPIDALRETLLLLVTAEPVAPLSLAEIQGYLEHHGVRLPRGQSDVRALLAPVSQQIQGLSGGHIRLALKAFAEHVWQRHLSVKDRRRVRTAVISWLATDLDARTETVARIANAYATGEAAAEQPEVALGLVQALVDRNEFVRLAAIGQELFEIADESVLATRCLERAAAAGSVQAMYRLGEALIIGRGREQVLSLGEQWLQQAISQGSHDAESVLGIFLALGIGLSPNPERGELLLRNAAEHGEEKHVFLYCLALFIGSLGPNGWQRARDILRSAVHRGVSYAKPALLLLLEIGGISESQDLEEIAFLKMNLANDDLILYDKVNKHQITLRESEKFTNEVSKLIIQLTKEGRLSVEILAAEIIRIMWEIHLGETGRCPTKFESLIKAAIANNPAWLRNIVKSINANMISNNVNLDVIMMKFGQALESVHGKPLKEDSGSYLGGDFLTAAESYLFYYKSGFLAYGNNLAYMLRRNEIPSQVRAEMCGIFELLDSAESSCAEFVTMNRALCYAAGVQCELDWALADRLVASLCGPRQSQTGMELLEWWRQLMNKGDPEGYLVVGWLARHGLVEDPEGQEPAGRFAIARAAGWKVPAEWDHKPTAPGAKRTPQTDDIPNS